MTHTKLHGDKSQPEFITLLAENSEERKSFEGGRERREAGQNRQFAAMVSGAQAEESEEDDERMKGQKQSPRRSERSMTTRNHKKRLTTTSTPGHRQRDVANGSKRSSSRRTSPMS